MAESIIVTPEKANADRSSRAAEAAARNKTAERDAAEKQIVSVIVALARKYNALEDLAAIEDVTIPNLEALAKQKGVPEEEFSKLILSLTPMKWQLEAVEGGTWEKCWLGLKERFAKWIQEIIEQSAQA